MRKAAVFLSFLVLACASDLTQFGEREARVVWDRAGYGATVAPDGGAVVFVDWNRGGDLMVFEPSTDSIRSLVATGDWSATDDEGFADEPLVFSPTGDRVAYPFLGLGFRYQLRTVAVADGVGAVLDTLPRETTLAPVAWHAEAGIAYTARHPDNSWELKVVDPAAGTPRTVAAGDALAPGAAYGVFTSDGSYLLYLAEDTLYRVPIAGGLPIAHPLEADVLLGWDSNGEILLYNGTVDGVVGNWAVGIRDGHPAGEPILARGTAEGVLPGGWTPEGAYYREPAESPRLYISAVGATEAEVMGNAVAITDGAGGLPRWPAWSPDGSWLAYSMETPNRSDYRIMVADTSGHAPREVARIPFTHFKGLQWTADNRSLIVAGRASPPWLGRIDVMTGRIEKLVEHPTLAVATGPGDLVAYIRPYVFIDDVMHMQVTVLGGGEKAPRTLATYPMFDPPVTLSVSPDGRWVAVGRHIQGGTVSVIELLPIDGGEPRTLLRLERPDRLAPNLEVTPWTAHGQALRVVVVASGEARLVQVNIATGELVPEGVVPLQGNVIGSIALHPDGRRTAFLRGRPRTEMKVMFHRVP
ncbi:MAG: hypothetical protein WEB88_09965 [Gemmatimonadota bacterium]